jgi:2-hydroxychromene-2-carboxylate isomerase
MRETVRFYFDVLCPWCYQTSRWARRLEQLGEISLEWGVFSLEVVNIESGKDPRELDARSGPALRTALLIAEREGRRAVGTFYEALGRLLWEQLPADYDMARAVTAALNEVGMDENWCAEAMADPRWWDKVLAEHDRLIETTGTFGVPTIVLDGGDGPAIFGPVVFEVPPDGEALELWRHVSWLMRYENFSELKRGRSHPPNLPALKHGREEAEVTM